MIVADAGVLLSSVTDLGGDGETARDRIHTDQVAVPHLVDIEFISALRGILLGERLTPSEAERALRGFERLPLRRLDHTPLLWRCWELRANLTSYDAMYVALAEALAVPLVTQDARLGRAPGLRCAVEVLPIGSG